MGLLANRLWWWVLAVGMGGDGFGRGLFWSWFGMGGDGFGHVVGKFIVVVEGCHGGGYG